jgi:hypothetical protein
MDEPKNIDDLADKLAGNRRIAFDEYNRMIVDVEPEEFRGMTLINFFTKYINYKNAMEGQAQERVYGGLAKGVLETGSSAIDLGASVIQETKEMDTSVISLYNDATGGSLDFVDTFLEEKPIQKALDKLMPDEKVSGFTKELARFGLSYGTGIGIAQKIKSARFFYKAIMAEAVGGSIYYEQGDPNFADFVGTFFDLDDKQSARYAKMAIEWAKSDEDDSVFFSKMKGVIGDLGLIAGGGAVLASIIIPAKMIRTAVKNPELMLSIGTLLGFSGTMVATTEGGE